MTGTVVEPMGPRRLPSDSRDSWAIAPRRAELYVASRQSTRPGLWVYSLEGRPICELSREFAKATSLDISSDERTLVVELPSGFKLVNLDSREVRDGPDRGRGGNLSPDGSRVAYLDGWELKLFHLASDEIETIAHVVPSSQSKSLPDPMYYRDPVWSPDGNSVLVSIGEEKRSTTFNVVFDLVERTAFRFDAVIDPWTYGFAPVATPFAVVPTPG